jgi:hypothetical protein
MNYFDSDMSKSTNTVVYFDWKTVITNIRQLMLELQAHSGFHDLFPKQTNKQTNKQTEARLVIHYFIPHNLN